MKQYLKNIYGAKSQALDFLADAESFLLITGANFAKKKAPQMIEAIPSEEIMTVSLAFLLANNPAFRRTMTNALKRAEAMMSKMN